MNKPETELSAAIPKIQPVTCRCGVLIFVRRDGSIVPHWSMPDENGEQDKCHMNEGQWCDCHLHSNQVCDICQGLSKLPPDATPDPAPAPVGFEDWFRASNWGGSERYSLAMYVARSAWQAALKSQPAVEALKEERDLQAGIIQADTAYIEELEAKLAQLERERDEAFNDGVNTGAELHDYAAKRYAEIGVDQDSAVHAQWAKNIRAFLLPIEPKKEEGQ